MNGTIKTLEIVVFLILVTAMALLFWDLSKAILCH